MGIGLTFDEYVEVKLKPPGRADAVFQEETAEHDVPDAHSGGVQPFALTRLRLQAADARPATTMSTVPTSLRVKMGAIFILDAFPRPVFTTVV